MLSTVKIGILLLLFAFVIWAIWLSRPERLSLAKAMLAIIVLASIVLVQTCAEVGLPALQQ